MTAFTPRTLLSDRLAAVQALRVLVAVVAGVVLRVAPELTSPGWPAVPALVAWLTLTTMAELNRRRGPAASALRTAVAMLALDGLVVGLLVGHTGGFRSPLIGLVYLHVIAVSLLVSHKVALRIAAWHGIVLFGGFVLAASETSGLRLPADLEVEQAARLAAVHASGFLVAALGVAAFAAMNERVLRRAHREVAALAAVGEAVGGTVDGDVALLVAATTLRSSLNLDAVAIAVANEAGCRASVVSGSAELLVGAQPGPLAEAVAEIAATDLVHHLADLDDRLDVLLPGASNVVVVPFPVDDGAIGVVLVALGGGRDVRVPETTVQAIEQAGRLVASALERARLHAHIERLANSDALTGLPNRRVFEESLERELARSRRTGEPVSLVVFDVDHFKKVNDAYGHHIGDEVLRHVGAALAGAIRGSDLVARSGGEEFVALLPGCGSAEAVAVGDAIRRSIRSGNPPVAVTASAGVATYPFDAAGGAALFTAADSALYEAKRGGRDRIVSALVSPLAASPDAA